MQKGMKYRINNMKYRIQVEELNNGNREYTPEVGYEQTILWGLFKRTEWYCILKDNYDGFNRSNAQRHIYGTVEEARDIITSYKKWKSVEVSKETKTISHIEID